MRIRHTLLGAIVAAALAAVASSIAIETADAHSGAVNAQGCHRDRKAGTRHCKAGELRTMRSGRQYVPCRRCGSRVKTRSIVSASGNGVERGAPARASMGGWISSGRTRAGTSHGGGFRASRGTSDSGGRSLGGGDLGNGRRSFLGGSIVTNGRGGGGLDGSGRSPRRLGRGFEVNNGRGPGVGGGIGRALGGSEVNN